MIEVEVEDESWTKALPDAAAVVERSALAALPSAHGSDLTILLTDDPTIRDLNARFRGKDAATNVLSFPAPVSARPHIGDVALAYGVCASEAVAQGKTLEHHLMHLTAHGVLHLLGYDHQTDAEAEAMEAIERRVLHDLGAPDPYGAEGHTDPDAR